MTVVIGYVNYAIVAVAGGMLCIKGLADVGALASYLVFVRQAAMPINQFTQLGNFLLNALAGAERLFAAMDLKPEVDEGTVRRFLKTLEECHISATRRREMGDDIDGACGQLRRKTLAESAAHPAQ